MHAVRMRYATAIAVIAVSGLLGACTASATDTQAPMGSPTPAATTSPTRAPIETLSPVGTAPVDPQALPVTVVQDILYLEPLAEPVRQRHLDIYIPGATGSVSERAPVVVFAHGYNQGKAAVATVCKDLAKQGLLVFAPNWPTNPNTAASWREMTESLACAVRFARATAPSYNGDPDKVALVGFSMGAGVGAIVAFNGPDLDTLWSDYAAKHGGPQAQARCVGATVPAEVQSFVGIGGAYRLVDRFQKEEMDLYALLTTLSRATDIKIALMHGEFDSTVPRSDSEDFQAQLIAAGYAPTLILYDSGHTIPRALTASTVVDIIQ